MSVCRKKYKNLTNLEKKITRPWRSVQKVRLIRQVLCIIGEGTWDSPLQHQTVMVGEQCFRRGIKEPMWLATLVTAPNKRLQTQLLRIKIDSA